MIKNNYLLSFTLCILLLACESTSSEGKDQNAEVFLLNLKGCKTDQNVLNSFKMPIFRTSDIPSLIKHIDRDDAMHCLIRNSISSFYQKD